MVGVEILYPFKMKRWFSQGEFSKTFQDYLWDRAYGTRCVGDSHADIL